MLGHWSTRLSALCLVLFAGFAVAFLTGPTTRASTAQGRSLGIVLPWSSSYVSQLDAFSQQIGRSPGIVGSYRDWTIPLINAPTMDAVISRGATPQITWEPWDSTKGSTDPSFALSTIANGSHDAYIRASAQASAAYGKPFQLRFAPEMNGSWAPWEGSINGNTPALYIAAWQHVVSLFRTAGATNVTWVWSPNNGPTSTIAAYYPGDSWVDIMGIDGYNWGTADVWQSFTQVFGASYDVVTALNPTKPVLICETASTELGGDKASWITSAYLNEIPGRFPRVGGVIWFNVDKEQDWRVDSSASALAAYQTVAASSLWSAPSSTPTTTIDSTSTATTTTSTEVNLAIPTVSVTSYGRMSVTLGWQAIAQATGYTVQTAIDPNFSSPSDLNVSKTAATVTGLHPATSYWFRVRATTGPSDSGWSAPVSVTTTGKPRK